MLHLEAVITRLRGVPFQLHVTGHRGQADGDMLCMTIASGVPLSFEFYNGPEILIDFPLILASVDHVHAHGSLTVPFDFDGILDD